VRTYQVVRSKTAKTGVLLKDPGLDRYIPETELYSRENLARMLNKYKYVYVKPDCGRGGNKVISINLDDGGSCSIHYDTRILKGKTVAEAAALVERISAGAPFIIQQGIKLLTINNVPFDLRVNVQKPFNRWEVTAMIARLRAPGKAVTNFCQGGRLVELKQAFTLAGLKPQACDRLKALLTFIGEKTAAALCRKYPHLRELGLDIGLDRQARPWIFEVNTRPQYVRGLDEKFDRYHRLIEQSTVKKYQTK